MIWFCVCGRPMLPNMAMELTNRHALVSSYFNGDNLCRLRLTAMLLGIEESSGLWCIRINLAVAQIVYFGF